MTVKRGLLPVALALGALRRGLVAGLGDDAGQRVQHGAARGALGPRDPSATHQKLGVQVCHQVASRRGGANLLKNKLVSCVRLTFSFL